VKKVISNQLAVISNSKNKKTAVHG